MQLNKTIIISFLCAFAPLRDKICETLRNPRLNISVISVNSWFFQNKIMRNKANFKDPYLTASTFNRDTYNDSHPKTKNGTNPNKPNFKTERSPVFQKNKKMENEPNLSDPKVLQVTALKRFITLFFKRKRTQTNPIKPIKANLPIASIQGLLQLQSRKDSL